MHCKLPAKDAVFRRLHTLHCHPYQAVVFVFILGVELNMAHLSFVPLNIPPLFC